MALNMRREFLWKLDRFRGAGFDADLEDLERFAPVQENLRVGAGGLDVWTIAGLQKLHITALTISTDDQMAAYVTEAASNFDGQLVCIHTHEDGYEKPRFAKQSKSDGLTTSATARFYENWEAGWGPVFAPWVASGAGIYVIGHAGIRPRFLWKDIVKNTGLKGLEFTWTPAKGSEQNPVVSGSIAAGTYEYGITLYDSTLARDGEMIVTHTITLTGTDAVVIAGPFSQRAYSSSGEPTGAHLDYYSHYRVWRRASNQTEFYLVGEVAAATAEAAEYEFQDTAANAGATIYIPNRRSFPSFRWCVFHKGRFIGLGLPAWSVSGTTIHCENGSKLVYANSAPPYFRPWMDSRTFRIQDSTGNWLDALIDFVYYDAGNSRWTVSLATAWAGVTGDYSWQLAGNPNTVYIGNLAWGAADMFCLDGTVEVKVNDGDGQEIVAAVPMMHRLMIYKNGSIWALTGGDWADPEDSTPIQNDLDYYLVKEGVGIPGPYCVCTDGDGAHWIFDGYGILKNTGTDAMRVGGGRTRRFFAGLDSTRFHEAIIMFDQASNSIILAGLYKPGMDIPSEGLIYNIATDALEPLTNFYVSGGGSVAQKW